MKEGVQTATNSKDCRILKQLLHRTLKIDCNREHVMGNGGEYSVKKRGYRIGNNNKIYMNEQVLSKNAITL